MNRITKIAFGFALSTILASAAAWAQTSAPSSQGQDKDQPALGDYARKVVRKDPAAAKPKPKVFDNDNLPTDDKLSVIGQPPSADAIAAAEAEKAAAPSKTNSDDDQAKKQAAWKDWQKKVGAQKDSIDLASRELDVLQREYQLRAAAVYADAGNRMRNAAEWDKQDAEYKQKIADKQKSVDDAKQKLEDMREDARKAGVPSAMIE